MNTAVVWVLSLSVLGTPNTIHSNGGKFATKQECLKALEERRQSAKENKQQLVGACIAQ